MVVMGRNIILAVLAMFTVLHASASARMSQDKAKAMADSFRNNYHLDELIDSIEAGKVEAHKLQVIYLILVNTNEWYIHRQRGADGNEVFLHRNGQNEAVFDKNGNPVRDGINDASYNYFHPNREPLKHFLMDIHPWLIWGATPRDPTSRKERVRAYMADLEGGIRAALATKIKLRGISTRWDSEGQVQALAFLLLVIEKGGADELFGLFEEDAERPTDEQILNVLKKLETGFNRML